ncbi:MAG: hypothetical protein M1821_000438 [Bathelium mastoideum]|nr:MAG: hypothetical protein M1821_000438 [Bathelium mastoideum]
MATFSTIANTFSVVGLAEVVVRATVELYALVKRASSDFNSAKELLTAVQSLAAVVAEVRIWAVAYEQSLFAQEDGQCVSYNVKNALEECGKQVKELAQRLAGLPNARKYWLQKITGRVACAFSREQIQHSLRMLIYHQTAIRGLMLARGGHDIIILRREIGHLKASLRNVEMNTPSHCLRTPHMATMSSTLNIVPVNESQVMNALETHQKVLERIATQTQGLQVLQNFENVSHVRKVNSPRQNDLAVCMKYGFDTIASQHDRWIAQQQRHIHESFNKWR